MESIGRRGAHAATRRARAALAWGLVLFVCGQVGVRFLLRADPEIGEREFGRKLTDLRAMLAENPGRPLILMLGSSRVATGFRPDALPRLPEQSGRPPFAFNFSLVGTGPEISHLILHRLLADGVRPAWVFVEYWPPYWCTHRSYYDILDRVNFGHLDPSGARLLGSYLVSPGQFYHDWLSAQVAPIYADRSPLLGRFAPAWVTHPTAPDHRLQNLDHSGWWSPHTAADPEKDRAVLARMRAHYTPILAQYHNRATPDRALRATLDLCRREGIHAAVVVLPEGDEFRSWYPPEALAKVDAYLDRLARECAVPVIDARTWVAESEFLDSHHLLPAGATRFTAQLGRAALRPLIADQAGPSRIPR